MYECMTIKANFENGNKSKPRPEAVVLCGQTGDHIWLLVNVLITLSLLSLIHFIMILYIRITFSLC